MAQEHLSGKLAILSPSASISLNQSAASVPRPVPQRPPSPIIKIPTPVRGTPVPTPISPGAAIGLLRKTAPLSTSQGPSAYVAPPRALGGTTRWRHNAVLGMLLAAMGLLVIMLKVLQRDAAFGAGGVAALLQEGALKEKRELWESCEFLCLEPNTSQYIHEECMIDRQIDRSRLTSTNLSQSP